MNFPKLFAIFFVIPYIMWLLILIVLLPISYGWTFVTLMFSMQPLGSDWICFNLNLLIEPLFGELGSVIVVALLGVSLNLAALYGAGFVMGIVVKTFLKYDRQK